VTAYLVDTNVISESVKTRPHAGVLAWLATQDPIRLGAVTVFELAAGAERMAAERRRRARDVTRCRPAGRAAGRGRWGSVTIPPASVDGRGGATIDLHRPPAATVCPPRGGHTMNRAHLQRVPEPVAAPGPRVVPILQTTNLGTNLVDLNLPGTAVNPSPGAERISEVFLIDGRNLLQLTSFRRVDTNSLFLGADRRRAFFAASADPLGTNPAGNCQVFSIGTLGQHLRQITRFNEEGGDDSQCFGNVPPGCAVRESLQDPVTRSIVFIRPATPSAPPRTAGRSTPCGPTARGSAS
jgi:hypothetical protein